MGIKRQSDAWRCMNCGAVVMPKISGEFRCSECGCTGVAAYSEITLPAQQLVKSEAEQIHELRVQLEKLQADFWKVIGALQAEPEIRIDYFTLLNGEDENKE